MTLWYRVPLHVVVREVTMGMRYSTCLWTEERKAKVVKWLGVYLLHCYWYSFILVLVVLPTFHLKY